MIDDKQVEEVDCFTYLGTKVTNTGGSLEDAQARIAAARGTMARLSRVWTGSEISRSTKVRIFNACVLPTLVYGCESWSSGEAIQECQTFVNQCLRRICRVFWPTKMRNEDLWRITGMKQICSIVESRRWAWVGHHIRRGGGTMLALKWTPDGQRRAGRPSHTLRRHMHQILAANGKSLGASRGVGKR